MQTVWPTFVFELSRIICIRRSSLADSRYLCDETVAMAILHISVMYFAVFRERINAAEQQVELPSGATVSDLLRHLASQHPIIEQLAGHYRIAVNQAFATNETTLNDLDVVALIPPVSGG
jgi:molybdopterin converting factor subunit 1